VCGTVAPVPGIREQVAAGKIDDCFLDVARRAARRASLSRPTPTGGRWTDEEVEDLVLDTVARVGPDKVVLAAAGAASDAEFCSWLAKALRTSLDLRARGTPTGRVIRSVDGALGDAPERFDLTNGHWHKRGDPRAPEWAEGPAALVQAAWAVTTATVTLVKTSTKTWHRVSRHDIQSVADAVLDFAGPLPKVVLAEVVAARFNVAFIERLGYDEADRLPDAEDRVAIIDTEDTARWMFEQLTEGERRLLASRAAGVPVRAIAAEKDVKKNQVEKLSRRLDNKVLRLADQIGEGAVEATALLIRILGQEESARHSSYEDEGDPDGP